MKETENKNRQKNAKGQAGFTLVEIAVVLVVVSIFLTGIILSFATYTQSKNVELTQKRMDVVLDALSIYVQKNNRLPCAADPSGNNASTMGRERNGGNCLALAGATPTEQQVYRAVEGIVPYRDLNLPEEAAKDAWGHYITYRPAPNLTINTALQIAQNAVVPGDPEIHNACRTLDWYSQDSTGLFIHSNKAKAMYCCNATPKTSYLNYVGVNALPANWKNSSVVAAGQNSAANESVLSTGRWRDDDLAVGPTQPGGQMDAPRVGGGLPDYPSGRISSTAVTLVSHGSNGIFSFMRGSPVGVGNRFQDANSGATSSGLEQQVANNPELVTGAVYNPKLSVRGGGSFFDSLGKRFATNDDVVSYVRNDELYARVGDASCEPVSTVAVGFTGICTPRSEIRYRSCLPSETGTITEIRNLTCPSGVWGPWGPNTNTCAPIPSCTPLPDEYRTASCPPGETGSIQEIRTSTCPGPSWSGWTTHSNSCVPTGCIPDATQTRTTACPPGQVGQIDEERVSSCTPGPGPAFGAWTVTSNTCTTAPNPPLEQPFCSKVDVMFMADNTGSMIPHITKVKQTANSILTQLTASIPSGDVGFAVTSYGPDPFERCGGSTPPFQVHTGVTTTAATAASGINAWVAQGGCDWDEANFHALNRAATSFAWRPNTGKVIVWLGDAPSHTETVTRAGVITALNSANIKVIVLNVGANGQGMDYAAQATDITTATNGSFYNIATANATTVASNIISAVRTIIGNECANPVINPPAVAPVTPPPVGGAVNGVCGPKPYLNGNDYCSSGTAASSYTCSVSRCIERYYCEGYNSTGNGPVGADSPTCIQYVEPFGDECGGGGVQRSICP